ncbi:MANBA-like protein [Mya arenaria]|uniref:Beta-mannosidase n=1 Tax=Mya arenaria TaxID=6604 RepID=A0ABY7E2B5_MYAAR|nr:MANBA-like protein [Mya arenaria]
MATKFLVHILFNVLVHVSLQNVQRLELNGPWSISNGTMSAVPARVPGGVHTALMDAGILKDPYFRKNDNEYRWVGLTNWTYTRSFQVSSALLDQRSIELVCEGLDTVAEVKINGHLVGRADNQFEGNNTIEAVFESAVTYGARRAGEQSYRVPPDCPPGYFHGECHGNMVRKMQCAFSWDWGPAFVTTGIWKDIYIAAFDSIRITDVTVDTVKAQTDGERIWELHVTVFTRCARDVDISGTMTVTLSDTRLSWHSLIQGTNIEKIPLNFTVSKDGRGELVSRNSVRFGFRSVQLVQDPIKDMHPNNGLTFYFRVNDQPIFLKGSNWVPADSFPERVTPDRLRNYMTSAADANMNAMRVWGGGIYESDDFYNLADELGILIWQDFMFACALYPVDAPFMASVTQEITYQVRRLKSHPSLLAWSGNNENEVALTGGWWGVYRDEHYMADYRKLYVDTVGRITRAEDPYRPFMLSSPSNGKQSEADGGISKGNPGGTMFGDIHDYQYSRPFFKDSTYQIPRMASEYGLQSFPSMESLRPVYEEQDLYYDSELNTYRQHHYGVGMRTETEHYRRWQSALNSRGEGNTMGALYWMFADIWPAPSWASIEYGGKWKVLHYFARKFFAPILISPYIEGYALKVHLVLDELPAIDHSNPLDIELNLKPEVMEDERPFSLFSLWSWTNDALERLKGQLKKPSEILSLLEGNLYMRIYSWDSLEPRYTEEIPFHVVKSSEMVLETRIQGLVEKGQCKTEDHCFVYFHLGDPSEGPVSWLPLSVLKTAIGLQRHPDLKVVVTGISPVDGDALVFDVHISTSAVAVFVWIEATGIKGRFSDNGFLLCDRSKTVKFYAWENVSSQKLQSSLTIKSLTDIYEG